MINDHTRLPKIIHHHVAQFQNEIQLELNIFLHSDLVFFKGHFENVPILPGIAQTDFVIAFAAHFLAIDKKTITSIQQLKFSRVILPDTALKLCISQKPNLLSFRYIQGMTLLYIVLLSL